MSVRVYRFSKKTLFLTGGWTITFLLIAMISQAVWFVAIGLSFAACASLVLLMCSCNRRIEIDGGRVTEYDCLGRLRVTFDVSDITGLSDSSCESDGGPFRRLHTTK